MLANDDSRGARDWVSHPLSWVAWWGLPIAIGMAGGSLGLTYREAAFVWSAALAWMGLGCVLNALRCHRLHCYVSGPVLLAGALVAALLGLGAVTFGPHALSYVLLSVFALVCLSFVPEAVWRKYA